MRRSSARSCPESDRESHEPVARTTPEPPRWAVPCRGYRAREHLSEAGLNRARVHVEVEWLLYLTDHELFGSSSSARPAVPGSAAVRRRLWPARDRRTRQARGHHPPRREGRRVPRARQAVRAGVGRRRRAHPFRLHERRHQQPLLRDHHRRRRPRRLVSRAPGRDRRSAQRAVETRGDVMLAHTHGQPATPTTVGKEFAVFVHRLERIAAQVEATEYLGKFSGATGTFAAHLAADATQDWPAISREFVASLGSRLEPAHHPDRVARLAGGALLPDQPRQPRAAQPVHRHLDLHLDGLLHPDPAGRRDRLIDDAAQDQPDPVRERRGEPRALERAARLARGTLVTSRLQRDLTDSTTQRNVGVAFGHSSSPSTTFCEASARSTSTATSWPVISTPTGRFSARPSRRWSGPNHCGAQFDLRPVRVAQGTHRGKKIGQKELVTFIDGLDIGQEAKARLRALTPATYIGARQRAGRLPRALIVAALCAGPCRGRA